MQLSLIIPYLNEVDYLPKTLNSIIPQFKKGRVEFELILVDGGSTDGTLEVIMPILERIEDIPLRLFRSIPGRAEQMNCGASVAKGNYLLFLHADTMLSDNAIEVLLATIQTLSPRYGFFPMHFDSDNPLARLYSLTTEIPSILTHYGDSGLFFEHAFFEAIGQFPQLPLMEDVEILFRARAKEEPCLIKDAFVITSARRFQTNGFLKQQLLNFTLTSLYIAGASPSWLATLYKGKDVASDKLEG